MAMPTLWLSMAKGGTANFSSGMSRALARTVEAVASSSATHATTRRMASYFPIKGGARSVRLQDEAGGGLDWAAVSEVKVGRQAAAPPGAACVAVLLSALALR